MQVLNLTAQDVNVIISGFSEALRKKRKQEQLAAIQAVVENGVRLGFAIDKPMSKNKPLDVTRAAINLLVSIAQMPKL